MGEGVEKRKEICYNASMTHLEGPEAPLSIIDVCASWEPQDQERYLKALETIITDLSFFEHGNEGSRHTHDERILVLWYQHLMPLFSKYNIRQEERDRIRNVLGFQPTVFLIVSEKYEMVENAVGAPIASIYRQITERLRSIQGLDEECEGT